MALSDIVNSVYEVEFEYIPPPSPFVALLLITLLDIITSGAGAQHIGEE